jgi:hypothetical protein
MATLKERFDRIRGALNPSGVVDVTSPVPCAVCGHLPGMHTVSGSCWKCPPGGEPGRHIYLHPGGNPAHPTSDLSFRVVSLEADVVRWLSWALDSPVARDRIREAAGLNEGIQVAIGSGTASVSAVGSDRARDPSVPDAAWLEDAHDLIERVAAAWYNGVPLDWSTDGPAAFDLDERWRGRGGPISGGEPQRTAGRAGFNARRSAGIGSDSGEGPTFLEAPPGTSFLDSPDGSLLGSSAFRAILAQRLAADEGAIVVTEPPGASHQIATIVVEHWRNAAQNWPGSGTPTRYALAIVLRALNGETRPERLGIRDDHRDAHRIRAIAEGVEDA